MIVAWFFLAVPWVCLHFVNEVSLDQTHYFCNVCVTCELTLIYFTTRLNVFLNAIIWEKLDNDFR